MFLRHVSVERTRFSRYVYRERNGDPTGLMVRAETNGRRCILITRYLFATGARMFVGYVKRTHESNQRMFRKRRTFDKLSRGRRPGGSGYSSPRSSINSARSPSDQAKQSAGDVSASVSTRQIHPFVNAGDVFVGKSADEFGKNIRGDL